MGNTCVPASVARLAVLLTVAIVFGHTPLFAEETDVYLYRETDSDRIQVFLHLLEEAANSPNENNVQAISDLAQLASQSDSRKRVSTAFAAIASGSSGCRTSIWADSIVPTKTGYTVRATVLCETPLGLFSDSISLGFLKGVSRDSAEPAGLLVQNLTESVSIVSRILSAASSGVAKRQEPASLTDCTPLIVSDFTSPHLLQQIPLYSASDDYLYELTSATRRDYWGGSLFGQPAGIIPLLYKEKGLNGALIRDYAFLIGADANWDRVIVTQRNGDCSWWDALAGNTCHEILTAVGSHGSGEFGFARPTGIAWAFGQFYVADTYNDRVQAYQINTVDVPAGVSFLRTIQDDFDSPVDVTAGVYVYDNNLPHPIVAILDQGNNRVYFQYINQGAWAGSSLPDEQSLFTLNRPTSLCFGRHPITHSPNDNVYVADNGNRRVIKFRMQGPFTNSLLYDVTPQDVFPADAFLSSVDVDNFGDVYVLDANHSVIYKFCSNLSELLAKFGVDGTSFVDPKRLAFAREETYNFAYTDVRFGNPGEVVVAERFGPNNGVGRYKLGFDVLAHDLRYMPKYSAYGRDYLLMRWFQTGYSLASFQVKLGSSVVHTQSQWLTMSGEALAAWYLPDAASNGNYTVELTLVNPYDGTTPVVISDLVAVQRVIDYTYFDCRVGYPHTYVDPPVGVDSTSDTCIYAGGSRNFIARAVAIDSATMLPIPGPFHWKNKTSSNCIRFIDSVDNWVGGLTEVITPVPWVRFTIPNFPSPGVNGSTGPWIRVLTPVCPNTTTEARSPALVGAQGIEVDLPGCGEEWMRFPLYWDWAHTPCYVPPVDPACPFLYKWNGKEYEFVNNLLPQSESMTEGDADVLDYYPIFLTSPVDTFYYKFLITEEEKEVSRIDQFELQAFDIPYKTGQLTFNNRQELVYLTDSLIPSSVITNEGKIVTDLFTSRDGKYFEAIEPGWVEITYDLAKALTGAALGQEEIWDPVVDPEPIEKGGPGKISGDVVQGESGFYTLSVQDETGAWQVIGKVHPRIRAERKYLSIPLTAVKSQVRLRLAWSSQVRLDGLIFYTTSKQEATPVKLSLVSARHSGDGLVQSRLNTADGLRQTLMPGDSIELTYYAPPVDTMRRVFMFAAKGKYRTLTEREITQLTDNPVTDYEFGQNYPNPFNPMTTFNFGLPQTAHVTLEVYNILGQRVATLADREYPPGRHSVDWDTRQASGAELASGVYFARLKAGDYTATQKMVVVK